MHAYQINDEIMANLWAATPRDQRAEEAEPYGALAPERTGKHPNLGGIRIIERGDLSSSTYILITEWPLCALDPTDEDGNPIAGRFSDHPELIPAWA